MPLPPLATITAGLPDTIPFVGPEAIEREAGAPLKARLGANESGFGPSPRVVQALAEAASQVWRYPDSENFDLRQAIASTLSVAIDEISVGEGIDGLMGTIARLFIEPGQTVVTSLGAYPTFNFHVVGFGGRLEFVPYRDDHEDLDALLAAVQRTGARMVYLANPDNPMGSFWPADAVERFADALPETCLLILDEAYGELAPDNGLPPTAKVRPNVIRLRTFSKAFGLAGLRCGYAIGDRRLIAAFNRVRNHFGVNRMAQTAALVAWQDRTYLAEVVAAIHRSCDRIGRIARDNGLFALPSATNFVAIDCGRDGAYAMSVLKALGAQGVFIRKPMAPHLDRCIRVSAAPDAELDIFQIALSQALRHAQGEA